MLESREVTTQMIPPPQTSLPIDILFSVLSPRNSLVREPGGAEVTCRSQVEAMGSSLIFCEELSPLLSQGLGCSS